MPRPLPETVPELVSRMRAHRLAKENDDLARAAVATIIKPAVSTGAPEILYIKRAEFEGDRWSGHVAFPGGKREKTDESLQATAIRETLEELALIVPPSAFVARMPDLYGNISSLQVAHFVFALDTPEVLLTPNSEVADAIWAPLSWLVDPALATTRADDRPGSKTPGAILPAVRLGKYTLWGMTFRLTRAFTDALLSDPA